MNRTTDRPYTSVPQPTTWDIRPTTKDGTMKARIGTVRKENRSIAGGRRTRYVGFLDDDPFSVGSYPTRPEAEHAIWEHCKALHKADRQ